MFAMIVLFMAVTINSGSFEIDEHAYTAMKVEQSGTTVFNAGFVNSNATK